MEKKENVTKSNKTVKKNTNNKTTSKSTKTPKSNSTKSAKTVKKTTVKSTKNTTKSTGSKNKVNDNKKVLKNEVENIVIKEESKKEEKTQIIEPKNTSKKETKNNSVSSDHDFGGEEIRKLLIIIGAVCAVMLAFYFITEVVLKNKDTNTEKEPEIKVEPEIQYEQILMGSLLNQNDSTYYVLAYDEEDPMLDIYNQYLESYKNSDNEPLNVYKVNLSEDFNKSYVAEESYLKGSDMSKIKVTGTTLIRIKNDEVYKYYEGYEEISEKLKSMIE